MNNNSQHIKNIKIPPTATAVLVLGSGDVFFGRGYGAETTKVGEVCFNTAMTGYQEIFTDPSYAGQIINFTFPHIGNVGCNGDDVESDTPYALGGIFREDISESANFRAEKSLDCWLKDNNLVGLSGVDTRALAQYIRDIGAPNGVLCHRLDGKFDLQDLLETAQNWPGLENMDLAKDVTCKEIYEWSETIWTLKDGYGTQKKPHYHIVAIDYGIKKNILRNLASRHCRVTVVPANTPADEILGYQPDGIFLSNGPGDPAATGKYAVPIIQKLIASNIPIFGICLGHQILALALGANTIKMDIGHRGANHPVKDLTTNKVEITSQNHGFVVDKASLPETLIPTHFSLFDGSLAGMAVKDMPIFSVQFHPEASPGPQDSHYLFTRFLDNIANQQKICA